MYYIYYSDFNLELYYFLVVSIEHRHLLKVTTENTNLLVHYVIKKKNRTLKVNTMTINGSIEDLQLLCYDIQQLLQGMVNFSFSLFIFLNSLKHTLLNWRGRHGSDRLEIGFTTTCVIRVYHPKVVSSKPVLDTTLCDAICQ